MIGQLLAAAAWLVIQPAPQGSEEQSEPVVNTGAGLLENCTFDAAASNPAEAEFHLGLCIGFIKGVTNTWAEQNPGKICPTDNVNNEHLREMVVNWLRAHPEALAAPAVGSVLSATIEAFPCNVAIEVERSSRDVRGPLPGPLVAIEG